ncbi:hypothetical protein PV379_03005 [Streptomyces caniscabiei]|uniref:hypothetical protein n=1 Tax=Streptomyces caniscabiei TaxID=2746961 RepID=UPI0029B9C046|nr:hypothetical protein [Streptomyces caniscabiei]MDX2776312.1 hypothetical protein [Streptomyces caniscabiei]
MKKAAETISKGIDWYRQAAERHPYVATMAETVALHGLRKVLERVGEKTPLSFGNALKDSHIDAAVEHPIKVAVGATLIAPLKEEISYRLIPNVAAGKVRKRGHEKGAKAIKAVAAVGFAAAHSGIVRPSKDGLLTPEMYSNKSELSVPVSQLVGGANYQRLYDQPGRGPVHSLVAHVTNNALEVAGALPELRRRRKQKQR